MPRRRIYESCVTECILRLLKLHGELAKPVIEQECSQECKCSRETVRQYLKQLTESGKIVKKRRGGITFYKITEAQ